MVPMHLEQSLLRVGPRRCWPHISSRWCSRPLWSRHSFCMYQLPCTLRVGHHARDKPTRVVVPTKWQALSAMLLLYRSAFALHEVLCTKVAGEVTLLTDCTKTREQVENH